MSKKHEVDFKKFDLEAYVGEFAERDTRKSRDGDAWFKCCFHEENTASLRVSDKQIYYCHGCGVGGNALSFVRDINKTTVSQAFEIIKQKSGQEDVTTTFEKEPPRLLNVPQEHEIEAMYFYNNGHAIKYRLKGKRFLWGHYNNGQWYSGTGDMKIQLYAPNGIHGDVILVEGEKDADALCQAGFTAVSPPNGANGWKEDYTIELKQANRVGIINDNDYSGVANAQRVQYFLKENGIKSKRISPLELNDNDIEKYDVYDVIQDIGIEETTRKLNEIMESPELWDVLWNEQGSSVEEIIEEKEFVDAEIVFESGLGEEYDKFIMKATEEMRTQGFLNEITLVELDKQAKETGLGKRNINSRIKAEVERQKKEVVVNVESKVMEIAEIGRDLDITDSGYVIMPENGAIFNDNGDEIIGHFLSFVGVVVDAEKEQDTDVKVMLAYNTPQRLDKINTIVVSKRHLSTSADIVNLLSGYNINVTQSNSLPTVKYLQDLQNYFGENTITMKSLSRFGWFENKLMPFEQDDSEIVFESNTTGQVVDKLLDTKGDKEKSRALLQEMSQYSESVAIIIGAAVGSLVLSYMDDGGSQSFAVNVWGGTSTGKSVACQGVASMFGYPYKDGGWWSAGNATLNADINHNSLLSNLPNFVDDPALNRGMDAFTKRDYIYAATSGQGRARMMRDGVHSQDLRDWCNVMIMTNETVFIDDSIADGGAKARCIEVKFDKPLDQETAERWIEEMGNNYGHFAVDIANEIRKHEIRSLHGIFKKFIRWFSARGVDGKRAVNASIIMMGLGIADKALNLDPINPENWLVKQIRGSGVLSDGERGYIKLMDIIEVSANAYREIYDYRDKKFVGTFGTTEPEGRGDKVVNLPYRTIAKYAEETNFNVDATIVWGMANGKMVPNYTENDAPKGITVSNGVDSIKVIQVYYDWEGIQFNNEVTTAPFEVIEEAIEYEFRKD